MKNLRYLLFFSLFSLSCRKEDTTANTIQYDVVFSATEGGTINTTGGRYDVGTSITITAQPSLEYRFTSWSNGSTTNPLTITVDRNLNLQANFTKKTFPLTLVTNGEGRVETEIVSSGKNTDYTIGTILRLTAVAEDGWGFTAWSGSISATTNPLETSINEAQTIIANFEETQTNQTTSDSPLLAADGPGGTYDLITSKLAPGYNPIETPDCNHEAFGDHIDEIYDQALEANVFRFNIHVTPDNDRCIKFDRQRNEIKTYNQSPENLLGRENETVTYSWKFKLPEGFQSSPKFTHLHQLKSVGGDYSSMPMYTLTTRKSSPDRLELRYAEVDQQITLKQTDLAPLINRWISVRETVLYRNNGSYTIE
ncbi:MAG: hypothetical protein VW912_04300, partial [Flavobacteriaceae bacterium]